MQANLTPEEQLILFLARGKLSLRARQQAVALLGRRLDWDLILQRITAEEIYALFYRNLCALDLSDVPARACKELQRMAKLNVVRNTLLTEELLRVLTLLHGAGIPTIPLKGVALAHSLYGDPTVRVAGDIDLLVPVRLLDHARDVLLAAGYQSEFAEKFFQELAIHSDCIEYGLTRQDRGCRYLVELHWGIMWGAEVDRSAVSDLWFEARPQVFMSVPCYGLSPEWELLFLAAHAARHEWQGLKWLSDIHEVCAAGRMDWQKVAVKAKSLKWERILGLTLSACRELFVTPLAPEFQGKKLPRWLKVFPRTRKYRFWHNTLLRLYLLGRLTDRLRFVFHGVLVPTPAERRLLCLPSRLKFLYYPLRPLRLGCKWSWSLVRGGFAARGQ